MKKIMIGALGVTVLAFILLATLQVFALTSVTNVQMLDMCSRTCNYMTTYSKVPSIIYTDDQHTDSVTAAEFHYMMSRWLRYYKQNSTTPSTVAIIRGTGGPVNPSGTESGTIQQVDILAKGESNANYIDTNGFLPNYSTVGSTQYTTEAMFSVFARTMNYYQDNGTLPSSATVTAIAAPDSWASSPTSTPTPTNTPAPTSWAIWIQGSDARSEGVSNVVNKCHSNGITDIFLLVKGGDGSYRFDTLDQMVSAAHPLGMKVHAWVVVLFDDSASGYSMSGDGWVNAKDNNYKNYIMNNIVTPLCSHNMDGIHFDCLRYPGNAYQYTGAEAAITGYCSTARTTMNNHGKSSIPLSAAIMPECGSDPYYYGQNAVNMSSYLGFVAPMSYIYNYGQTPSWVGTVTSYFVGQCASGCKVWAGIQTIKEDGSHGSTSDMRSSKNSALNNGAKGITLFRYALTTTQWSEVNSWTP